MQENISLKDLTTMKVGGRARFFVSVKNESELVMSVSFARDKNLPIFVLGGGSNVVISDEGFAGLVIKNEILGMDFDIYEGDVVKVTVGAGVVWDKLVLETTLRGLYGIENLSFIPGTVGAAPVQNIGAYGVEIKETVLAVRAFDLSTGAFSNFTNDECDFSYRDSYFKRSGNFIITSVEFLLSRSGKSNLSYKDIYDEIQSRGLEAHRLTPSDVRELVIAIRKRKLPDPKRIPTAGSFFKNPEITSDHFFRLREKFPDLPGFELAGGRVKIPLAWIIESVLRLKGFQFGGAAVYDKHALVLVNNERARAVDIYNLAERIRQSVFDSTSIAIEAEVQFVGEF